MEATHQEPNRKHLRARLFSAAVNAATVIGAIYLIGLGVQRYLAPRETARPTGPSLGTVLDVPDVQWAKYSRTMLVVLQVGCRYCEASASFYQRLIRDVMPDTQVIAVLPNDQDEARDYLKAKDLTFHDVLQMDLLRLQVPGTPAILIGDNTGRLRSKWIGLLTPKQEREVRRALNLGEDRKAAVVPPAMPTQWELAALRNNIVIDVRSRQEFALAHLAYATNIPVSELATRANHEVPLSRQITVYCEPRAGGGDCGILPNQQRVDDPACDEADKLIRKVNPQIVSVRVPLVALDVCGLPVSRGKYRTPEWRFF